MPTNLKTLSRQYANGTLSKEEYRQARMDLLERVHEDDTTRPQTTLRSRTGERQQSEGDEL
ncbi:hypothetical protein [Saccharospirillum mangrovi]|uniref:hypothetical protein n=1 Tax=Saccharospirillum mangrovi TaxID=2161747 RepID=UPI000D3CEF85|nr:hypothetical protein [Saccharospirillum mangrovi]